jgi:hypothetical protein
MTTQEQIDKMLYDERQEQINKMLDDERKNAIKVTGQWNLGQLIDAVKSVSDKDKRVKYSHVTSPQDSNYFGYPAGACSWRGIYKELAIGYKDLFVDCMPTTVLEFLILLKGCVGTTFYGWKGGEYTMTRETPVWVDSPGDSNHNMVYGISESDDWVTVLVREQQPYLD